jgi:hypothetical protein
MSRYVNADKLVAWCMETYRVQSTVAGKAHIRALLDAVDSCPTADVVEVRHGEWEIKSRSYRMIDDYDEEMYVECPFCKRTFYVPYEFDDEKTLAYARENYPYCHCGAKMDGERREE